MLCVTGGTYAYLSISASSNNKMDFAEENPMTFATDWKGGNVPGYAWHTSGSEKGLYDPCPVGYRVPDGGDNGGKIIAEGTPGQICKNKNSYTGLYLSKLLEKEKNKFFWNKKKNGILL